MEFIKDFEEYENTEEAVKALFSGMDSISGVMNELAERIGKLEKKEDKNE